MKVSEVLYGAADHIAVFGHAKNRLHGYGDPQTAPACAIGAVIVASGMNTDVPIDHPYRQAGIALVRYLQGDDIATWNNAPERTAAEVIEVLRACALIEAAKERADVHEVVPS